MNATEESILNAALDKHNLVERAAYLNQACTGDSALRNRVEQLVSAYGEGEFLEAPVAGLDATSLPDDSTYIGAMVGHYKLVEQIG
jgi:hypothetical protein